MNVNKSIFVGDDTLRTRHGKSDDNVKKQTGRKSIDASALQMGQDPITAKRKEAQKKAMKIVGDAFASEKKVDDDLDARRAKIKSLQKELGDAKSAVKEIEADRAVLRDTYGVETDSKEEKDLKLLEKEIRARMPGSDVRLTKDDMEAIERIKKEGLSEYQQRSLEMLKSEEPYMKTAFEAEQAMKTENQIISTTKIERLKSHAMIDAQGQADGIMDAASKEIIGMLVDEAKEHIDEETEKREEQAKAEREKKEELEEKIEAAKEKKKEQEELTEEIIESTMELTGDKTGADAVQQELKELMNKMKLIEDDIKGAEVDKKV